jgi:hypothetical protein
VGSDRSGTTLLRAMLDASPVLCVAPESHFLSRLVLVEPNEPFDTATFVHDVLDHPRMRLWDIDIDTLHQTILDDPPADYPDAVRRLFEAYAVAHGKSRYADKTPGYRKYQDKLAGLFPEARFIHLIRDGRDVAPALVAARWGFRRLGDAAISWQRAVQEGWATGRPLGQSRYLEINYEELVADPELVLGAVCSFIDIPFVPEMLHPEERAEHVIASMSESRSHRSLREPITVGLRDWRRDLTDDDVALLEALAGHTLEAAGYERRFMKTRWQNRARAAGYRARFMLRRPVARVRLLRSRLGRPDEAGSR